MSQSGEAGYKERNEQFLGLDVRKKRIPFQDFAWLLFNSVLLLALCGQEALLIPLDENLRYRQLSMTELRLE